MILSVVSYEVKNIIFYEKNLKRTTNNTFNSVFVISFFFTIASYEFFNNNFYFIYFTYFENWKK